MFMVVETDGQELPGEKKGNENCNSVEGTEYP
jgi:hypothetical protein